MFHSGAFGDRNLLCADHHKRSECGFHRLGLLKRSLVCWDELLVSVTVELVLTSKWYQHMLFAVWIAVPLEAVRPLLCGYRQATSSSAETSMHIP